MKDVTDATFAIDVIERSKSVPVVVDLWADWCGPCTTLVPIIEKVVDETNGAVELAKVDVDANPEISAAFRVQSIPAVFAIKDGCGGRHVRRRASRGGGARVRRTPRAGRLRRRSSWSARVTRTSLREALALGPEQRGSRRRAR